MHAHASAHPTLLAHVFFSRGTEVSKNSLFLCFFLLVTLTEVFQKSVSVVESAAGTQLHTLELRNYARKESPDKPQVDV